MKNVILWATDTEVYKYFLKKILPKLYWKKPKFDPERIDRAFNLLINRLKNVEDIIGAVVSTRDPSKVSGIIVPTDLDHSALIVGWDPDKRDYKIVQAVADGVEETYLKPMLMKTEGFTIHIGIHWSPEYVPKMAEKARSFIGLPYDGQFQFGIKALYCSEVVYHSDIEKRCWYDLSDAAGVGTPYISPKGITEAVGMLKIFDSEMVK